MLQKRPAAIAASQLLQEPPCWGWEIHQQTLKVYPWDWLRTQVAADSDPWPGISERVKTFGLAVFSEYVEFEESPAEPAADDELGAVAAEVG